MSERRPRILLVDDEEAIQRSLMRLLRAAGYDCTGASSAAEARQALTEARFDCVISDVNMPGDSGIELVDWISKRHDDVAVIMLTGEDTPALAARAIELGAYGYVLKPYRANELLINLTNALRRRTLENQHREVQEQLEMQVRQRTLALSDTITKLRAAEEELIKRLGVAAELRDNETAQHVERMSHISALVARTLGMDEARCELVRIASPFHDLGKIGIPDQVLLKPGKLDAKEWEIMKTHAEIGHRVLAGSRFEVLQMAATIAWTHHEKYDGSGYPRGLAGEAIPIEGRIIAVADVFDALTSRRCYKEAFPLDRALAIMREGRGAHFDPVVLDRFLSVIDEVVAIKERYPD